MAGPVRLYEADGATGHEVHSCALGADPTAIALETGSDRVVVAGYSRSEVAVIDMAGCRVVQRIVAVAVPIAVAIDEKDGRLAIESSDAPPEPPPGRQPAMPTSTTVTIVPLMR